MNKLSIILFLNSIMKKTIYYLSIILSIDYNLYYQRFQRTATQLNSNLVVLARIHKTVFPVPNLAVKLPKNLSTHQWK